MLGKQSGQMGFGDLEATGRVPEGHFLKKIDGQIDWRPFEKVLEPLYHPKLGRPSHPPLVMFQALPPRRGEPSPDPEADWTRRGKDGHFGYKVHLTVDQGSGLIRRLALTSARTSESNLFEGMVIGDEAAVFADGAYAKDARKKALRGRGVFCGIINRPWRYRSITEQQKRRNKFYSRIRRAVERVIGTLKCRYGMDRCRYVGGVRNRCHLWLKGICYNLRKMLVLQGAT